ncbi:MAG TPA: YitT family protein [Bacillota bacterium]|nr:YitT family protein [Bacillota bacterium]
MFKQIVPKNMWKEVIDYLGITIGVTLTALGLVWFLIPNKIAAGGVSGLGVIFFYLWKIPVSLTMLVLNVPLFLACVWVFGPRYGGKTLYGSIVISVMIQFWESIVHLTPLTANPLLASLYGGVIAGIGMGISFRFRGTTGGTDLAAQLFNRATGVSVGYSLFLFDGFVVVLAGLVFHSSELALYAIITIFVTSKFLDSVLEGWDYAKAAWIISDHSEIIGRKIIEELNRGATGLFGQGLYSTKNKQVILSVISRAEETKLKELVNQVDPNAFVIITDAREVLGEGFRK